MKAVILFFTIFLGTLQPLAGDAVMHALNRLGYGPRQGDVENVRHMGVEAWIAQQLEPESLPMPETVKRKLEELQTIRLSTEELYDRFGPRPGPLMENDTGPQKVFMEASQARILYALESPRQLYEVMVDFWFNHFNVSATKDLTRLWVGAYERDAIRPYAMGNFLDLLKATARHPAMLYYSDNWQNRVTNTAKKQVLNETYARFLLEQTLGVGGGYTDQDVTALARIMTGWGFSLRDTPNHPAATFWFNAQDHDDASKILLGRPMVSRGILEGEESLNRLNAHPSTAKHISYKLAQYFVEEEPDADLVKTMTERFQQSHGDVKEVLKVLFSHASFWKPPKRFKTPYQFILSAVRAADIQLRNTRPLINELAQEGMPLYLCPTHNGYSILESQWLNGEGLLSRTRFAMQLATGRLPMQLSKADAVALTKALEDVYSPNTLRIVDQTPEKLRAGLLLGSPEFMRY